LSVLALSKCAELPNILRRIAAHVVKCEYFTHSRPVRIHFIRNVNQNHRPGRRDEDSARNGIMCGAGTGRFDEQICLFKQRGGASHKEISAPANWIHDAHSKGVPSGKAFVLTPRYEDLTPVLGPVVITPPSKKST
jgi:hypothetical protein